MDRKKIFDANKVGIYECSHCYVKFPFTTSSQKLEIVRHDDFSELRKDYENAKRMNEELLARSSILKQENSRLREKLELLKLESTADALDREVSDLRQGKGLLQEQISIFIR